MRKANGKVGFGGEKICWLRKKRSDGWREKVSNGLRREKIGWLMVRYAGRSDGWSRRLWRRYTAISTRVKENCFVFSTGALPWDFLGKVHSIVTAWSACMKSLVGTGMDERARTALALKTLHRRFM